MMHDIKIHDEGHPWKLNFALEKSKQWFFKIHDKNIHGIKVTW